MPGFQVYAGKRHHYYVGQSFGNVFISMIDTSAKPVMTVYSALANACS